MLTSGLRCWLFAFFAGIAAIDGGAVDSSLLVGTAPAYPATTVSIPVTARSLNAVVAAQFDVTFSPERAALANAIIGRAGSNHRVKSVEVAPGVRRVLVYSMN